MWELDCEESWTPKKWCFWTVVLEKTFESLLDCKEIQPVHSERDQPWVFFGRNDAKAETPVLWPLHAKSWLIGKDSDAGRDWGQEEKGTTEDEMTGWHHWRDRHESEWTPGVGDEQGGLACCDSWGRKELDTTEQLNWTDGVKMMLDQLHILCEVQWPPVRVGWPPENTMNLKIMEAVYTVVTGEPGHPDQYPYIDSWLGLAQDAPIWTRFCTQKGKGKILMAQKLTDDKKGNSTGFGQGWPSSSPILDNDAPASQSSTRTRGCLNAWSRARWTSCSSCCSSTSSPIEPLSQEAPIPLMETSGQRPQNSTSAGSPRLNPPLPVSTDGKGEENTGIRQRLCSAKEQGERTPLQMRLRELQQPPVQDSCGHYHQPPVAYYYQPFSSIDILNWQRHTPPYSGEPQAMIRLLETIFRTYHPTWDD